MTAKTTVVVVAVPISVLIQNSSRCTVLMPPSIIAIATCCVLSCSMLSYDFLLVVSFRAHRDLRRINVASQNRRRHLLRLVRLFPEVLGGVDLTRESLGNLEFLEVVGRRRLLVLQAWRYHRVAEAGRRLSDLAHALTTRKHLLDLLINLHHQQQQSN